MNEIIINRQAEKRIRSLAEQFPVVVITGPRQAGKTWLTRHMFIEKPYVTLENPDTLQYATDDPRGFLARYPVGAILDEVQNAPQLLSYIQGIVDENRIPGMYILTGSQQLSLVHKTSQSLAGRAAYFTLLPCSLSEITSLYPGYSLDEAIFRGGYAPIHVYPKIDAHEWLNQYIATYVERDVRQVINVRDLSTFRNFLRRIGGRCGQMLNLTSVSNDCGIAQNTVKDWLSILEGTSLIFYVRAYSTNLNQRAIKTPKLYFTDTGLAARLLGIEKSEHITTHPLKGALFENLAAVEMLKGRINRGASAEIMYYREKDGFEVDFITESGSQTCLIEAKAGMTINREMLRNLKKMREKMPEQDVTMLLLYGGQETYQRDGVNVCGWDQIDSF